ncbi:MAG: glycosyltransferase [Deltaproteobacteria bacterium]|nr:glycosyltransferase [Deltaproteobacteria bacterium]
MSLLHILPSIAPETGGPSVSIPMMCKALADEGNRVVLFTTLWPRSILYPKGPEIKVENNVTIHLFPTKRKFLTGNLPYSPRLIEAIQRTARNVDFTLVHSLWNPLATFAARTLRRLEVPYGIMAHGMLDPLVLRRKWWKKTPWLYLYERENIEKARILIFTSQRCREKALDSNLSFQRTFIFPHIIDLAKWKRLPARGSFEEKFPPAKGREIILFVGRINWVKNLDKLLLALSILKNDRPQAMVVCAGPDNEGYQKILEKQALSLGISDSLLFTGILSREDLRAAYARADVFALISKKENFGLFVAEALACGIPGVISEGVDIAPLFRSKNPLRVVKPCPGEIAAALKVMLERSATVGVPDPEAWDLAEKEWGENKVHALVQTYREILGKSS